MHVSVSGSASALALPLAPSACAAPSLSQSSWARAAPIFASNSKAFCHQWLFTSDECGTVGDNVGSQLDAAHLNQRFQGLLPPLALLQVSTVTLYLTPLFCSWTPWISSSNSQAFCHHWPSVPALIVALLATTLCCRWTLSNSSKNSQGLLPPKALLTREGGGTVGDNAGELQLDAMDLVKQFQGLLPPLALCARADCGTVGDNVVLQLDAVEIVQKFPGLLPSKALLTSDESGPVGDNVGLQPDATHFVQRFQGLLPPLALLQALTVAL